MRRIPLYILLLLLAATARAEVTVKEAWARATTPAQKASGAFMELTSSESAALVSASSSLAGVVEIHTMKMEDGVMKMRAVPRIELPAGKTVALQPGGYHVMLMQLKQQLKKGDTVPITLKVEGANREVQAIEVKAEVRDLAAPATMGHGHKH